MYSIASAVRTGRVLFSTTIFEEVECSRIWRAVFSQYCRSAALPAPCPKLLVGVFTLTKMISASAMCRFTSVEKIRFLSSRATNHFIQSRLVDRQLVGLPGGDAFFVDIHHHNPVFRAVFGDHCHGRSADVSCANAKNVCH